MQRVRKTSDDCPFRGKSPLVNFSSVASVDGALGLDGMHRNNFMSGYASQRDRDKHFMKE